MIDTQCHPDIAPTTSGPTLSATRPNGLQDPLARPSLPPPAFPAGLPGFAPKGSLDVLDPAAVPTAPSLADLQMQLGPERAANRAAPIATPPEGGLEAVNTMPSALSAVDGALGGYEAGVKSSASVYSKQLRQGKSSGDRGLRGLNKARTRLPKSMGPLSALMTPLDLADRISSGQSPVEAGIRAGASMGFGSLGALGAGTACAMTGVGAVAAGACGVAGNMAGSAFGDWLGGALYDGAKQLGGSEAP